MNPYDPTETRYRAEERFRQATVEVHKLRYRQILIYLIILFSLPFAMAMEGKTTQLLAIALVVIGLGVAIYAIRIGHRYRAVYDYEPTTFRGKSVQGKEVRDKVATLIQRACLIISLGVYFYIAANLR